MPFFPPFLAEVGGKPFICYTDTDMTRHYGARIQEAWLRDHLNDFALAWQRTEGFDYVPDDTDFMIGFLWTDEDGIYVDVWLNRRFATYGVCGPMRTLQSFHHNGTRLDPWEKGNACDWTVIVCGREAEHFITTVRRGGWSIWEYCNTPRPELPEGFIVPWPDPDQIDPDLIGKTN
jgi:hypothetical protein